MVRGGVSSHTPAPLSPPRPKPPLIHLSVIVEEGEEERMGEEEGGFCLRWRLWSREAVRSLRFLFTWVFFLPILLIKCPKSRQKTLHNFLKLKLTPLDVLWCPMKSPKPRQKIKNWWKRFAHKKKMIQILSPTQTHIQSELSLTHSHLNFHRFYQKIQIKKIRFGWSEESECHCETLCFIFPSRNKAPEVVGLSPVKVRIKVAALGAEKESLEFRAAVQTTWVELIPEIKWSQVELIIGCQRKLSHIQQQNRQ